MSAHRWERERAAWAQDHSRAGTSGRRRAELLAREARRGQLAGAGVGAAPLQDDVTPPLWRRLLTGEDVGLGKKVGLGVVGVLGTVIGGVGIAAGQGVYRVLLRISPRIGRLWWWPWAVLAALLLALRWMLTDWPALGFWLGIGRYFPGSFIGFGGWAGWLDFQLIVAAATTAYLIRAWGWPGVPRGAVAPPERNKDGSFYVTPDKDKARLDPLAGYDDDFGTGTDELDDERNAYENYDYDDEEN